MSALAIAAAYLLGATITYGICWNWYVNNGNDDQTELRAQRPDLTDQQFTKAMDVGHAFASTVLAAVWPVTAAVAAWDAIRDRIVRRRTASVDVGQTITVDGQPMLVTSIRTRQCSDGGTSGYITCTSPARTEGDTQ